MDPLANRWNDCLKAFDQLPQLFTKMTHDCKWQPQFNMPSLPSMPSVLSMPSALSMPSLPSMPDMFNMPNPPKIFLPASIGSGLNFKPPSPGKKPVDLSGVWVKDKKRSSSMEEAIKLMELGGVMRTAIRLVRGMELKQNDKWFEMAVFSAVPGFKIREKYPMDGSDVKCRRRDFRRGGHKGHVALQKEKLVLDMVWEDPKGGVATDLFYLATPDELRVDSTVKRSDSGATANYVSVYQRKK